MLKILFITLGSISLLLGIIGIFVPGLPTTPFLLLTAALYMRGSTKLYQRVIRNKFLGPYILQYHKNRGMTLQQKFSSMGLMWFMIIVSAFFFIHLTTLKMVVIGAGVIGTVVMGFIVPTSRK